METDIGLLIMRVVVGLIFAAHGAQKAFGWWNGPGPAGWTAAMNRMGLRPAPFWAFVSTAAELGAGTALALGLLTPLVVAGLTSQAVVIIFRAHWAAGFWNANRGFEFPLALFGGILAILFTGPGAWALDTALPLDLLYEPIVRWGVSVVAVIVGFIVVAMPKPTPPAAPQPNPKQPS
jgi:putative oxidoreductase